MGKIILQWSDLAFIIMYNDANSFEKVKNTLFIKNVLRKTYFLPKKTYVRMYVFHGFMYVCRELDTYRYLLMVKMNLFRR